MVIYMITNLINGKKYIGKDKHNDPNYYGSGTRICQAIIKYGKRNFKKEIIEECTSYEQMGEREVYWIKQYNAPASREFYNIAEENYGAGNFKGFTEEDWERFRSNCSIEIRRRVNDPASNYLANLSKGVTRSWENHEIRKTHIASSKRYWDNAPAGQKEERRQAILTWWSCNKRENNNGGRPPKTILSYELMVEIMSRLINGESGRAISEEYNTTGYMIEKMRKQYEL